MRIDAHPMRIGRCIRMANPSPGPIQVELDLAGPIQVELDLAGPIQVELDLDLSRIF